MKRFKPKRHLQRFGSMQDRARRHLKPVSRTAYCGHGPADANRVVYRQELWAELTWRIDICLSHGSGEEIMVCASSGPRDQKFPRHIRARTRRLRLRRFTRSTIAAALQATSRNQSQFNDRQMVQAIVSHATTIAASRTNSTLIFP